MSLLREVGTHLQDLGIATLKVDLFLGTRPEEPDDVLVVHEYPGQPPDYQNDGSPGPVREEPQIQVEGRGKDYESVRAKVQEAWVALAAVTNQRLSGVFYLSIRPNSSPALLGRDQSDRVLIGFNASVRKEIA